MAVRDLTNSLEVEIINSALEIITNGTANTLTIDVSNFDSGFTFFASTHIYSDGTYTMTIQDSPDDSVWTDVPADKLNDPGGVGAMVIASPGSADGDFLPRIGAFSTNKFVRIKVVSSGVTSGTFLNIQILKHPEQTPA